MDNEKKQQQSERIEQQKTQKQELQNQLTALAVYSARAIRLGITALTGGLSKVIGLLAGWAIGFLKSALTRRVVPKGPSSLGFIYQHKKKTPLYKQSSFLILLLIVGALLLPFLFLFLSLFASMSGFVSKPLTQTNQ